MLKVRMNNPQAILAFMIWSYLNLIYSEWPGQALSWWCSPALSIPPNVLSLLWALRIRPSQLPDRNVWRVCPNKRERGESTDLVNCLPSTSQGNFDFLCLSLLTQSPLTKGDNCSAGKLFMTVKKVVRWYDEMLFSLQILLNGNQELV